jgi:hypothetical protein
VNIEIILGLETLCVQEETPTQKRMSKEKVAITEMAGNTNARFGVGERHQAGDFISFTRL